MTTENDVPTYINRRNDVAKEYLAMAQDYGLIINPKLKDVFEGMKRLPTSNITNEIAIMRTMLAALLSQIPQGAELRQIPIELADMITNLAQKVTKAALAFEQIQDKLGDRIGPEKMKELAERFVGLVIKHFEPDAEKMQAFADDLMGMETNVKGLEFGVIDRYGVDPTHTPVHRETAAEDAAKVVLTPLRARYTHATVEPAAYIGDSNDPFASPNSTNQK